VNEPLLTRLTWFQKQFPLEPSFRWKQIQTGLFHPNFTDWHQVLTIPFSVRNKLKEEIPWLSFVIQNMFVSKEKNTYKALFSLQDGFLIESVIMKNTRKQWTVCVSSQVGCAMRCTFCATGKMGLKRNLLSDEIVDQYRFWQIYLSSHISTSERISNVVFMGMGEPLANYESVREALHDLLAFTSLGSTRITVSTVGIIPRLEQILTDPKWPAVRLAISLHSADPITRKQIIPSSYDDFFKKLITWSKKYQEKIAHRRQHLTFEYILLRGINDDEHHAKALVKLIHLITNVRVNLIPYNITDPALKKTSKQQMDFFQNYLKEHGVQVTIRKSFGDEIQAACGQLVI